jgi:Fe-S-cluster containining protein
MNESAETPAETLLVRDSAFSYECRGCGRCCHHKRIPLGPYDVLRLARHAALTTGEFLRRHVATEGPWLASRPDGSCVFLDGGRCTVHPGRPLACRVYPLGRWVTADEVETFRTLRPHPQSEGRYGQEGTVAGFLERQGLMPYLDAVDRLQGLFYRLFDALQGVLPERPELREVAETALLAPTGGAGLPGFAEWLDADGVVTRYCQQQGRAVPGDIEAVLQLYIEAIDAWLKATEGEAA